MKNKSTSEIARKMVFFLVLVGAVCCSVLLAQAPSWTPITGNQYNMIAMGNVYRNGVLLSGSGYWVGTYGPGGITTDCRSVGQVATNGSYYATIRGNTNGDLIHFIIYESSSGLSYNATETVSFLSDDLKSGFNLNYSVTMYTIDGSVTVGGSGLAGVVMNGLPGNPTTNASGVYTATVSSGWSGTVTPTLTGYTFTPTSTTYTNVTANQTTDYTAAAITFTISGTVTVGGTGLAGVVMNGLPGSPTTNASGTYSAIVNYGWSGTASPTLTNYAFTPSSSTYTNVTSNLTQNYTAVSTITYTISGAVTLGGSGLAGVVMNGLLGNPTTNASGAYTATVASGWSGTVTPTLAGYTFSPSSTVYTNVTSNQTTNYTASAVPTYTVSGTVTLNGSGMAGVLIGGLPGNPVTNTSGVYSATVSSGWSGTATPVLTGYTFTPPTTIYSNVTSNQTTNYTATAVAADQFIISGAVLYNGAGLGGVELQGLPGNPVTGASGGYSATLEAGWSGVVTPVRSGYTFTPASSTYNNIQADQQTVYIAQQSESVVLSLIGAHANTSELWWTRVAVVNTGNTTSTLIAKAYNAQGNLVETKTIQELDPGAAFVSELDDLFSEGVVGQDIWLEFNGSGNLKGVLEFGTRNNEADVIVPMIQGGATELVFPYVYITPSASGFFYTGLTLVNLSSADAEVVLSAYSQDGVLLNVVNEQIPARGKYVRLVDGIFPGVANPNDIRMVKVTSSQQLAGFELFGSWGSLGLAGLPACGANGSNKLFYLDVPDPSSYFTGMTFSPTADNGVTANAFLRDISGGILASRQWTLNPGQQITREVWGLADGKKYPTAAYVSVESSSPLRGFELFYNYLPGQLQFDGVPATGSGHYRQVFPLVRGDTSLLRLLNPSESGLNYQVTAYSADGQYKGAYYGYLNRGCKQNLSLGVIFSGTINNGVAWLKLEGTSPVIGEIFIPSSLELVSYLGVPVD